jgi:hypothetical protein
MIFLNILFKNGTIKGDGCIAGTRYIFSQSIIHSQYFFFTSNLLCNTSNYTIILRRDTTTKIIIIFLKRFTNKLFIISDE